MKKKVTILVPCYNEEKCILILYSKLVSIISLHQQYNWELLFVNDGSTDNTLSMIEGLNAGDPRVAYIDQSRNFGKENLIYFPYMRIHSFEQQHMANISRIME